MVDWRNTSAEIWAEAPNLAILPLAAVEQHGPHLPLATDLLLLDAFARHVADSLPLPSFLLPTFPYGTSRSQAGFAGTLWMSADTVLSVVRDVVESLYAHDISRVVVLNNHGMASGSTTLPSGNFVVKTAVRQLNYDHPDRITLWVQPIAAAGQRLRAIFDTALGDELHAGAVETSMLLHLRPDLVGELPSGSVPNADPAFLDFVAFDQLCSDGVWGHPRRASRDLGAQAFAAAVEATVAYIEMTLSEVAQANGRAACPTGPMSLDRLSTKERQSL